MSQFLTTLGYNLKNIRQENCGEKYKKHSGHFRGTRTWVSLQYFWLPGTGSNLGFLGRSPESQVTLFRDALLTNITNAVFLGINCLY